MSKGNTNLHNVNRMQTEILYGLIRSDLNERQQDRLKNKKSKKDSGHFLTNKLKKGIDKCFEGFIMRVGEW